MVTRGTWPVPADRRKAGALVDCQPLAPPRRERGRRAREAPMNRYWTLSGKPLGGWPEADSFALREGPTPEPGPGQALTRTIYVSLDPYQWGYKKRGVEAPGAP